MQGPEHPRGNPIRACSPSITVTPREIWALNTISVQDSCVCTAWLDLCTRQGADLLKNVGQDTQNGEETLKLWHVHNSVVFLSFPDKYSTASNLKGCFPATVSPWAGHPPPLCLSFPIHLRC